ncbi:MAG: bacitracin ABC transporter permease [Methanosphaera sp. rholeuAM130]|nr:MAG: bacitracin ABC transporter permease [Methanosphaera sp. rholeuAM130]
MYNFIQIELMKLKRSKIFILTLLGAIFPSFLLFLSAKFGEFTETISLQTFLSLVNMYMSLIFAILLFTIIMSYLFGREYNEHTLKTILTAPTSRGMFILTKYAMFLLWILLITVITCISGVMFGYLAGTTGFGMNVVLDSFRELLFTNILLYLTFTPLVFITLIISNLVPAMIGGAVLTFTNMIVASSKYGIYFPWSCPYLISSGEILEYTTNYTASYVIIIVTFLAGLIISYAYFRRNDIPL